MKTLDDIPLGTSWATRFRTVTFVTEQGTPVRPAYLKPGDIHPGTPGAYEGIGIIKTRDRDQKLLTVIDTESHLEFTVSYEDCWDWDTIEWITSDE